MQTLSYNNNTDMNAAASVPRELTAMELEEVSGGSYGSSLGTAVTLVVAGAALAGSAPIIAGALVLGSIGASSVAFYHSWNKTDKS